MKIEKGEVIIEIVDGYATHIKTGEIRSWQSIKYTNNIMFWCFLRYDNQLRPPAYKIR